MGGAACGRDVERQTRVPLTDLAQDVLKTAEGETATIYMSFPTFRKCPVAAIRGELLRARKMVSLAGGGGDGSLDLHSAPRQLRTTPTTHTDSLNKDKRCKLRIDY